MDRNSTRPPAVLIIEDEDDLRLDLAEFFLDSGWDVETAASGREALLRLGSTQLDLWIVDLRLPDMDGLELLEQAKREKHAIGTIVLTSSLDDADLEGSLRRGCDLFLYKTASLEAIKAAAENLLRRQNVTEPLSTWSLRGRELHHRPSGAHVRLTPSERCLLAALGGSPGESVPRETLLKALNRPYSSKTNLEVLVSRLRRKLDDAFEQPLEIIPLYGIGYMVDDAIQV